MNVKQRIEQVQEAKMCRFCAGKDRLIDINSKTELQHLLVQFQMGDKSFQKFSCDICLPKIQILSRFAAQSKEMASKFRAFIKTGGPFPREREERLDQQKQVPPTRHNDVKEQQRSTPLIQRQPNDIEQPNRSNKRKRAASPTCQPTSKIHFDSEKQLQQRPGEDSSTSALPKESKKISLAEYTRRRTIAAEKQPSQYYWWYTERTRNRFQ